MRYKRSTLKRKQIRQELHKLKTDLAPINAHFDEDFASEFKTNMDPNNILICEDLGHELKTDFAPINAHFDEDFNIEFKTDMDPNNVLIVEDFGLGFNRLCPNQCPFRRGFRHARQRSH